MGLVILPVICLLAAAWLAVALLCAVLAWVIVRRLTGSRLVAALFAAAVLPLSWYLPNVNAMRLQREIDRETVDCGWSISRTVDSVPGVYSELQYGDLVRIYSVVESPATDGRVVQYRGTKAGVSGPPVFVPGRTLRYGFRSLETSTDKLRRTEMQVVDYETQEVIARNVQYELLVSRGPSTVVEYALYHLAYRPEFCRFKEAPRWEEQIQRILKPIN